MNRGLTRYLPLMIIGLCFFGKAWAVPVTYTGETYMANAYTRAWDTSTTPAWTLLNEDTDNPPTSSTPPVSAHVQIPGAVNQVSYHGEGDAISESGHLEMSALSISGNPDYDVFSYAHAGFVGDFTAATTATYFGYSMAYDLSTTGSDVFAGFSHSWSLVDITTSTWTLVDGDSGAYTIDSGSQSDTVTDEIMLPTSVGNNYRFYFDSGPFLDAHVTGVGTVSASLVADYGLDTETTVSEPATILLLCCALAVVTYIRRRLDT